MWHFGKHPMAQQLGQHNDETNTKRHSSARLAGHKPDENQNHKCMQNECVCGTMRLTECNDTLEVGAIATRCNTTQRPTLGTMAQQPTPTTNAKHNRMQCDPTQETTASVHYHYTRSNNKNNKHTNKTRAATHEHNLYETKPR